MKRTRKRGGERHYVGNYTDYNGVNHSRTYSGLDHELCVDSLSAPPHTALQNFYVLKERKRPPGFSGTSIYFGREIPWSNWELDVPSVVSPLAFLEPDGAYVTRALARENTEKGELDLPLFTYELLELGSLVRSIKSLGEKLMGNRSVSGAEASDAYLMNEFGISPLLSDISKILGLQRSISQRLRRLNKQAKGESVGGTLEVLATDYSGRETRFLGQQLGLLLQYDSRVESRVWYTLHPEPFQRVPPQYLTSARVLGLNQPLVSLWGAIPWSFLFDYFFSLSSLLESRGSEINIRAICLMKHRRSTTRWRIISGVPGGPLYGGLRSGSITSPKSHIETKERNVYPNPKGGLYFTPWLSNGQRANITALLSSNSLRVR